MAAFGLWVSTVRSESTESIYMTTLFFRLIFLSPFLSALSWAGAPLDIGSRRELFVDRFLIGELKGASLKLHTPQLAPPVSPSRPDGHYATVLRDGGLLRFYYRGDKVPGSHWKNGWDKYHEGEVTLAAESEDGIHWTLPNYGVYQHPTFAAGNVVLADQFLVTHNFTPFVDQRPGVPKEERYKGLGGGHYQKQFAKFRDRYGPGGLKAYVSPDGIHWKLVQEKAVIPEEWGTFDSQNVAFWSEAEQMYLCYFRVILPGTGRTIARTTSRDFRTWSDPVVMKANAPGEELYTNGTHPYFRAPHIYVALPTRYVGKRGSATDIAFMSTRGGHSYDRTYMDSLIRPGLGKDGWGDRANYAALGVIQTGPWEMSIMLTGGRRFTLRIDGFASVNAPFVGGELVTKPLTFTGRLLEINYSTSAGGQIRVEILDQKGEPVPGFTLDDCLPIFGDEIERTVKWKTQADLSALEGKTIRLRFSMSDADLYSLKFN